MIVIILNGPGEVGKGTFLELLQEAYSLTYTKYSSIAWAKRVAEKEFGWDGVSKTPEERLMIAKIKQLGIQFGNIPFKKVVGVYRRSYANHDDLFVTDVREPSEIEKLVKHFKLCRIKCVTIRIENLAKEKYALENLGEGDDECFDYSYDLVIPNNGTVEEFRQTIIQTMSDGVLTFRVGEM